MSDGMLPLRLLSRTAQVIHQHERWSCKLEQLGIRRDTAHGGPDQLRRYAYLGSRMFPAVP